MHTFHSYQVQGVCIYFESYGYSLLMQSISFLVLSIFIYLFIHYISFSFSYFVHCCIQFSYLLEIFCLDVYSLVIRILKVYMYYDMCISVPQNANCQLIIWTPEGPISYDSDSLKSYSYLDITVVCMFHMTIKCFWIEKRNPKISMNMSDTIWHYQATMN